MFKFLPGLLLIQLATIIVTFALMNANLEGYQVMAIALLVIVVCILTALWFNTIASNIYRANLEQASQKHARERENLIVHSERQKVEIIRESHEKISRETSRAHGKANLKVGAMFATLVGAGALMLFAQFITVGVLVLSASGGALLGYIVRARQESLARKRLDIEKLLPTPDSIETNSSKRLSGKSR